MQDRIKPDFTLSIINNVVTETAAEHKNQLVNDRENIFFLFPIHSSEASNTLAPFTVIALKIPFLT